MIVKSAPALIGPILTLVLASGAMADAPANPYQWNLVVAPGDGADLKADAKLNAQFSSLQTSLRFAVEANPNLLRADPLSLTPLAGASRETLGLDTAWMGVGTAKLNLTVNEHLDQAWAPILMIPVGGHQIDTDDLKARLDLSLSPLKSIDLTVGGGAEQRSILDTALAQAAAPGTQSLFATASQSAHADLKWTLLSWLRLTAGGKLEAADAQWRGPSTSGGPTGAGITYAYAQPSLDGAMDLPGHGKLDLSLTRAVSPIDAGAFSAFAAVEDRAAAARFGPNREWRYRLALDERLQMVKVSAALTEARIESATELGPVGPALQAPVSITGGERQQVDLNLSSPLTLLGLPNFTFSGSGAWRSSRVRDPFTGEIRPASAESPQVAKVSLVQTLVSMRTRWGLEGQFGGDQALYQMSEVSRTSVDSSLGGFVEVRPGAFALRLQVDGLYGGEREITDFIFTGDRVNGNLERVDHRFQDGQAVRLVLKKSL